ncbi:hypothetical protein HZA86_03235 [Candidatus Uhrbacteria bacterium]|nr:hypothetical protein [Candidatus Uhrbacteria bacterium]
MPDVNLLPGDQRDRERKEQELLKKAPRKVEIALTNPAKDPKAPILPPAHLPKPSLWERLFGPPKKSKVALPPKAVTPISSSPSLLPKPPAKVIQPPIHSPKPSWWSKLWAPKPIGAAKAKAPTPPTPVPAQPHHEVPVAPNLLHGVSAPPSSPFVLPPQSPPPAKPLSTAKSPTPPMPIRSAPPAPSVISGGTISATPTPTKTPVKFTKPDKEKEPEKKTTGKDSVTLLPEEFRPREAQIETKLVSTVLGSVIVAAAIVAAALFVLDLFKLTADNDLEKARRAADDIVRSINQKADMRSQGEQLQKKMAVAGQLLDRHIYWTKWLAVLEARTNVDVQWSKMVVDAGNGTVQLDGTGKSFTVVAQQIVAWRETPAVDTVVVTSASGGAAQEGDLPKFSFTAKIKMKEQYTQDIPDPDNPGTTITITRGVITTTRQEAEADQKAASKKSASLDLQALFNNATAQ